MAGDPGRARTALRRGREDPRGPGLPLRRGAVLHGAKDSGVSGCRRRPRLRGDDVGPGRPQTQAMVPCPSWPSRSRTRAGAPVPGQKIEEEVRNLHDRDRQTCRLCGECDIGCNVGAKNSLDFNYLTLAVHAGAEIRTLAEVADFEPAPDDDGYVVRYVQHPDGVAPHRRGRVTSCWRRARSERLICCCAAATVLRHLSPMIGRGFSGNGDLFTAALSAKTTVSDRAGRSPVPLDASHGPVITSTLRSPDERDGADPGTRGFYLQDAGYPATLSWLLQVASFPSTFRHVAAFVVQRMRAQLGRRGPTLAVETSRASCPTTPCRRGRCPCLGMGLDVARWRARTGPGRPSSPSIGPRSLLTPCTAR